MLVGIELDCVEISVDVLMLVDVELDPEELLLGVDAEVV